MRFTTLLNSGATAKSIAKEVATELKQRSEAAGDLCVVCAADFINECFAAIGFHSTITPENLQASEENYQWPEEWRLYTFNYNSLTFTPFETFLVHLCGAVHEQQVERQLIDEEDDANDELECPVEWLMELLAYWSCIYRHLENEQKRASLYRFKEPLARINFNLLVGVHSLRKAYRVELPLLDNICDRLYRSAVEGIFYEQAHEAIVTGLLNLFEQDFDLFYDHAEDTLNVYHELFAVEQQKYTYLLVFKRLRSMLDSYTGTSRKLLILTNFLVEPCMQEVYYTTLKLEKTKRILLEVLKFLQLLLSKVKSLDCFSQDFIESILAQVVNTDSSISGLAAELYFVMMRNKFSDDLVLKYILEFYLHTLDTPKNIKPYMHSLWPHLPYMHAIDIYLEIIKNRDTNMRVRLLTSFVALAVYEIMLENFAEYQPQIEHTLEILPQILEDLKCHITIGILVKIYAATDLELLKDSCSSYKQILQPFEMYAARIFTHATNMQFPLLQNIFVQLNDSLIYTRNLNIQECTYDIYKQHERIEKLLQQGEEKQNAPKSALLREYRNVLRKLSIIHMTGLGIVNSNEELFNSIKARLIDSQKINRYVVITNSYIDVYAIEVLTNCLRKMVTGHCSVNQRKMFAAYAEQLLAYLLTALRQMINAQKKRIVHIKTIFCSLISLYCTFHNKSAICSLKLEPLQYCLLVDTLLVIIFRACTFDKDFGDEDMKVHPKRTSEYQKLMLLQFTLLHATKYINIPSNMCWKVCVNYGLPPHKFNDELASLLQNIAQHHVNIYKHISGVIVYNLHKPQSSLADVTVLRAIQAHRTLIDTQLPLQSREVLKVHIVLVTMQIIEKSLEVLEINVSLNRLVALKYLHVFVNNLNVSTENVLPDILQQANLMKQHLLTSNEQRSLQAFLKHFETPQI